MDVSAIRASMKELANAKDSERILEVLGQLQREFKPTEALLRETKLGVAVNKLRTHSDDKVSKLVVAIIGDWKDQVTAQKERAKGKRAAGAASASAASASKSTTGTASAGAAATAGKSTASAASGAAGAAGTFSTAKPRNAKNDGVDTDVYNDKTRNSCVGAVYNALCVESSHMPAKILEAAKKVEAAVFVAMKSTSPEYRAKIRSLFSNLRNPKNPELREAVVAGTITPERLREMTPQELAPQELRKEMEEINKQNLFNAQGAKEQRATTDRFTCGKCKQKKVSYSQMQTRSADEPLTTFCQCEVCGNRWKFS